ncbi:DUF5681 domain-containing protein [Bradyrhizobium sp. McL0616]|uniref:DUF5681 domain-containing protein n=1 Tax=Bradyrhizobium sp. McL0616 TaxID=3415674 RepID=UPI003CF4F055
MADDAVGYGRPPKQSQFKPGSSGNPRGRPRRKPTALADVISGTLTAPIQYREHGRTRTTTRAELGLKVIVDRAVKGDINAADLILKIRADALRGGVSRSEMLEIDGWLRDFPNQTAEQKAADIAGTAVADSFKE